MYLASISRSALLQCSKCAVGGQRIWLRGSTTGVFKNLDKLIIYDEDDAYEVASRLTASEQELLRNALKTVAQQKGSHSPLSSAQTRQLFVVNTLPFIGFGMLDNMIMIVAGEYIDQQLGVYLTISTMAAAALGNLISDVAGVGLAHYVEILIHKCGFRSPVLSSEQLETPKTRFVINCARAIGLTIGCLIGMFPLLFFDEDKKD